METKEPATENSENLAAAQSADGEAPERVWLFQMAGMDGRWVSTESESAKANYGVEYVRADLAQQPAGDEVAKALEELRGMFGKQHLIPPIISAGYDPNNDWKPLVTLRWVSNGVAESVEAPTLAEALQQVRDWKERQK